MKLDNGILHLELTNKGGEMTKLLYKGQDVLYKGDREYWSGKNPTLFPFISSPDKKQYEYQGKTYPCRNHGLIRYSTLKTLEESENRIVLELKSNSETLKEYPFDFTYHIIYSLDNNRVNINYEIVNDSSKTMLFTFGLHPGFEVRDFDSLVLSFKDEEGILVDNTTRKEEVIKLKDYTNFLEDLNSHQTVIFKDLKSPYVIMKANDYSVKVSLENFRYLALWSPCKESNFICIEPWMSINDIKPSNNPFREDFELIYLKPKEVFKTSYYIEID